MGLLHTEIVYDQFEKVSCTPACRVADGKTWYQQRETEKSLTVYIEKTIECAVGQAKAKKLADAVLR